MSLKRIIYLLLLITLTACTPVYTPTISYTPQKSDVQLKAWQEKYPVEYADWEQSIHGQQYLQGNTDVPGCIDCHADPDLGEIQTAAFHLDIPNRCARCHTDAAKMGQYGISTDVYSTYTADYHGATIAYYQQTAPDIRRFEAVCSDCHGSHLVFPPEDERSSTAKAKLSLTCQKCHPDVSLTFGEAYGHYRPLRSPASTVDSPLVFIVKLVYQAMIPISLGLMVGYIGLDVRHRIKHRRDRRSSPPEQKANGQAASAKTTKEEGGDGQ